GGNDVELGSLVQEPGAGPRSDGSSRVRESVETAIAIAPCIYRRMAAHSARTRSSAGFLRHHSPSTALFAAHRIVRDASRETENDLAAHDIPAHTRPSGRCVLPAGNCAWHLASQYLRRGN